MKILPSIFLLFILAACAKEEATPTQPIDEMFDPATATLLREGMLMGSGSYTVSGQAQIYDDAGTKVLYFENLSSSNGPDLRVYLSTDINASAFINLGKLKSVSGDQAYTIPGNPDFDEYKFVLIWCQAFSVRFGKAETL
jgi:hypothetical protein